MSLLAIVDGQHVMASPGAKGTCTYCSAPMIAKCGKIVVDHWAHAASASCDPWRQGETAWHLELKRRFLDAGARVEVRIERRGEIHIADVVAGPPGAEIAIELAGVYPPADQIGQREAFYGRMAWIYNCARFIDRVETYLKDDELRFRFKQPVKVLTLHRRPVFWHLPDEEAVNRLKWIRRYEGENYGPCRTYGRLGKSETLDKLIKRLVAMGMP